MKTTLEIPDAVFRRAKSAAAERGIPLREFVTEAVRDKLVAEDKAMEALVSRDRHFDLVAGIQRLNW
jgi:hypothetical protein